MKITFGNFCCPHCAQGQSTEKAEFNLGLPAWNCDGCQTKLCFSRRWLLISFSATFLALISCGGLLHLLGFGPEWVLVLLPLIFQGRKVFYKVIECDF